jgi:hypothetical protein
MGMSTRENGSPTRPREGAFTYTATEPGLRDPGSGTSNLGTGLKPGPMERGTRAFMLMGKRRGRVSSNGRTGAPTKESSPITTYQATAATAGTTNAAMSENGSRTK